MSGRTVFDRWLTISTRVARTYRVAVWRIVRGRRGPASGALWSAAERVALAEAMRRIG